MISCIVTEKDPWDFSVEVKAPVGNRSTQRNPLIEEKKKCEPECGVVNKIIKD